MKRMDESSPRPACFVIAEIGVNHNGSVELAKKLVNAAAQAGADAAKFQTFSARKLVRPNTRTAAYQRTNAGETDQLNMLEKLELSEAAHAELASHCAAVGIEFMSTPFDEGSADLLVRLGVQRLKIPSGELTNHPLLTHLARKNLPLILSTGMATLAEVAEAVQVIDQSRTSRQPPLAEILTLLHCTSNYPTAIEDVNLGAMGTLRDFLQLPVGYSDHTSGTLIPVAAVALGARVIEKHFTLDRQLAGPDHLASIEPKDFAAMTDQIRTIERSLGDGVKVPRESEIAVRDLVRRSIVTARNLPAGTLIGSADLSLLRPGTGLAPREMAKVIGRRTRESIPEGTLLSWDDLV